MKTITDIVTLARTRAVFTLDQVRVFGSIPESRDVNYEILISTLYKNRASLVQGLGWNFGKVLRLAHDQYDKALDVLLNE